MSKLDSFMWWANLEVYRGEMLFADGKGYSSGILRIPSKTELNNYFIEAGLLGGYDPKAHWCGIFQTYLLKKAGIQCHWVISKGIKIEDVSKQEIEESSGPAAMKDLAPGDIVVVKHHGHHIMVLEPTKSGSIKCIEGNARGITSPTLGAYYTGNNLHNVVQEIQRRYRILS